MAHSSASLAAIKKHLCSLLDISKSMNDFTTRLDGIDEAYARYQAACEENDQAGKDRYGQTSCDCTESLINPVVISQVDSMVAYWAEVFLSGYPIFPVVSTPERKDQAEALEGIVQDHLMMSESIPEIQLLLRDAGKYNFWAVEPEWAPIKTYQPFKDIADFSGEPGQPQEALSYINYINRLNPRNVHWDRRIPITKVDSEADFVGYTKIYTRMGLKDLLNRLTLEKKLANPGAVNAAMKSTFDASDFNEDPVISHWSKQSANTESFWDQAGGYIPPLPEGMRKVPENGSNTYLVHTFYLRLIPSDFGMVGVPNKNSVQIWKVRMVNRGPIISLEPYTGAMGRMGIFLGQAIEDGMDLQTQSYAELAEGIQDATTRLFNIYFHGAKRGLMDRALYNPDLIRASDINSPFPAAKIPVKSSKLLENGLASAFYQIPYNTQGVEGALQSALLINDWSKELTGQNSATRGQFTKGNRTLGEFSSIMGSAENRMRLSAMMLEYRMFTKLKEQIKLNILQFGESTQVISPRNGKPLEVNIEELQKVRLQFELADGYTPKSKMANTDLLTAMMQLIGNSPFLAQVYGARLPGMLAHLAQLGGLRGFDQYAEAAVPEYQSMMALQQQIQQLMAQLQQNQALSPEQAQQIQQAGQQAPQQ